MFGSNQEWRVKNSLRKYPLTYDGDLVSTNTGITLPLDFISDLLIVVQSEEAIVKISSIHLTRSIITVLFCDEITGVDLGVAQHTIGSSNYREPIQSIGNIDVSGWVSFGTCISASSVQTGRHEFRSTNHSVNERCYMLAGSPPVTSIRSEYGSELQGLVEFLAGGGFSFEISEQVIDEEPVTYIVVELNDPSRFIGDCTPANTVCECDVPPIARINTVYPDGNGNIEITSDELIEIEKFGNRIEISFAKPSEEVCIKPAVPTATGVLPGEEED